MPGRLKVTVISTVIPEKEDILKMPKREIFRMFANCSNLTRDHKTYAAQRPGILFDTEGISRADRRIMALLACSAELKQFSWGLTMAVELLEWKFLEEVLSALLVHARRQSVRDLAREELEKSGQDIEEVIEQHRQFIGLIGNICYRKIPVATNN